MIALSTLRIAVLDHFAHIRKMIVGMADFLERGNVVAGGGKCSVCFGRLLFLTENQAESGASPKPRYRFMENSRRLTSFKMLVFFSEKRRLYMLAMNAETTKQKSVRLLAAINPRNDAIEANIIPLMF